MSYCNLHEAFELFLFKIEQIEAWLLSKLNISRFAHSLIRFRLFVIFAAFSLSGLAQTNSYSLNFGHLNTDGVMLYYSKISPTEVALVRKTGKEYSGTIKVPGIVNYEGKTYFVTKIGEGAFRRSHSLKEVSLPDRIVEIERYAFYGCDNLCAITLSVSLKVIGEASFAHCPLLKITFPKSLESIGSYAFSNSNGLISIPNTAKRLPNWNKNCDAKIIYR